MRLLAGLLTGHHVFHKADYNSQDSTARTTSEDMTMKSSPRRLLAALIPASVLIFAPGTVRAQDPVQVAPNNFRVLLENDRVCVLDFHGKAGQKIPMHSHPAYVTYSIHGSGKTKFASPDGKISERPATTGEARWRVGH